MKNKGNDYTEFNITEYKKTKLLIETVFSFQTVETYKNLILMGGAVKGGKSFSTVGAAILICNTYKNCRGVIVRKTNKVIERNLLPVFSKLEWLCDSNSKLKKIEGDYVKQFNNGSEIRIIAENYQNDKELNALKGFDINFYVMEEGNELQEATFNMLNTRNGTNRHTCDIPPIAIITCNPTFGWLKKKVYDRIIEYENIGKGLLPSRDIIPAPDNWIFIPSTAKDNPKIPKSQFEEWRNSMTSYDYNVMILGNWGIEKKIGAFLKAFDPDKNLSNIEFNPTLSVHITFDENVLPYITCAIWQIDIENKKIIQVTELPMAPPKNTAKNVGVAICEYLKENNFSGKIYIYGDATSQKNSTLGKTFYTQVIEGIENDFHYEKRILKRNENVALTGVFVNNIIAGATGWQVLINEKCSYSISDYADTVEDENGGIKKKRETFKDSQGVELSYEKNGHFTDSLRYFFVAVFWNEYLLFKKRL